MSNTTPPALPRVCAYCKRTDMGDCWEYVTPPPEPASHVICYECFERERQKVKAHMAERAKRNL